MRRASTVVTIVRMEVTRRKNSLSITRAVKSKLMTDESYAKTEFLSTKRTQEKYKKKSVLWSILSNSSVSRTMSCHLSFNRKISLCNLSPMEKDDMKNLH